MFIQQVSGPRARTSLWNDPFNAKGKQKFTIQEIQQMKNAISKAHWSYIEQTQKEALSNPKIQACELNVLSQLSKKSKGKNRAKAQLVKGALKKVNFATKKNNYTGEFVIFETPVDEVLPSKANNPLETFGQQILPALELRRQLGNLVGWKRKSEFRKSAMDNLETEKNTIEESSQYMEDKENTPLTTPISADSTMNKTISIPLTSKNTEDLVDLQGYKMSPGTQRLEFWNLGRTQRIQNTVLRFRGNSTCTYCFIFLIHFKRCFMPQIGKDKIIYVRDGRDRLIPLPIKVDKHNINNFKRVSQAAQKTAAQSKTSTNL